VLRDDPAPPQIPDYQLLRKIGQGSYGVVWLAQGVTGVYRAVKIVWRASFEDPQPYEREFHGIKEFAAVSLIEPRQLALLHVGRNDAAGFFYYVMELADDAASGREIDPGSYVPHTLREARARRGRLRAEETLALGVDLAGALAGLHAHELVHRDIKPSNIIFVGGVPKLADIGLVTSAATTALTMSRVGNAGYMPPDLPGTPSADVYGLGKVLYELATGRGRDDYPRLPANLDALPDRKALLELNEIFVRACHANPEKRYSDAAAMRDDLLLLQAGKSVRRLRAAERHLGRALRAAAMLAVAAIVAVGGAWLEHRRAAEAEAERDSLRRRATYSANLARVQRAIDNDELRRARQLLQDVTPKPGEPDLRGFEWHALWREARGDPHSEIRGAGPEITAIALSFDESLLAVHDRSDVVTIYDAVTRRERSRAPGVRRFGGMSRDGRWIFGADPAGMTRRWACDTGLVDPSTEAIPGTPAGVTDDDSVILVAAEDANAALQIWDPEKKRITQSFDLGPQDDGMSWATFRSAASKDGRLVIHAGRRGTGSSSQFRISCIRLNGTPAVVHRDCGRAVPVAVGIDDQGGWAFFDAKGKDANGEIWRCPAEGWEKTPETLPPDTRRYLEFNDAGHRTAIVSRVRQLAWLKEPGTDIIVKTARGHNALINDIVVSTKHQFVCSGATDGSVFLWDLDGPAPKRHRGWDSLGGTTQAVFLPDGKGIWVPENGGSCALLDIATLRVLARAEGMVYPIAIRDNVLLGVSPQEGLLRVNASTGKFIERIMASGSPARAVATSADGREVAVIDHAGNLLAATPAGPKHLREGLHRYYRIVMDDAGQRLWMAISTTRELVCISWPDGRERWRARLPALASAFMLLPGQQQMVVALENGFLELRQADTGETAKTVDSGSAAPQTLAIMPNGKRLFVAGMEGEVHCFELPSWEQIHTIPLGRGEYLHRMGCAPDGKTVGVLTRSGVLHLIRSD
jgi:WD40 repeat protein